MKKAVRRISEDLMVECLAVRQDNKDIPQADIENVAKSILLLQADFVNRLSHVDKRQVKRFFAQYTDDLATSTNEIVDSIFHLA